MFLRLITIIAALFALLVAPALAVPVDYSRYIHTH
jgi:hypothetical protein